MSSPALMWSTPFLSDRLWLLTAGTESRRTAPHPVLLGVAAAALHDLEQTGEVTWSGHGDAASLDATGTCRCEDSTLQLWHQTLARASRGAPLPARFALAPLARRAWSETACRLVESETVSVTSRGRGMGRRTVFAVRAPESVMHARHDLAQALEHRTLDERQHDLVSLAWATGCFDDLFHPHGWEAAPTMLEAARREVEEDPSYGRVLAACAFSAAISDAGFTS